MERESTNPGVTTAGSQCLVCRNLDFRAPKDSGLYLTAQLLKSTYETSRCNTCLMLLNAAMRFPILEGLHVQEWFGCFILSDTSINPWHVSQRFELYTLEQQKDGKAIPTRAHISGDTGSNKALDWAKARLGECATSHSCFSLGSEAILPARVLDLGLSKDPFQDLRLYETNNKCAPYACLSHCWGGSQPLRATKATLSALKNGIEWTSLPKTFQEASRFVKQLRIRYLWIDSLCIIQDDDNDWAEQSGLMCSIFQNSTITVAATASSNCQEGCYRRAHLDYCGYEVSRGISGNSSEIYVRKMLDHSPFDASMLASHLNGGHFPLLERAWVFQERLLAPRMLHFGSQELIWECQESVSCECGSIQGNEVPKFRQKKLLHRGTSDEIADYWRDLVREYSYKKLTFPSDRLPALSGLAKEVARFRKGPYLAGLWGDSLIYDLLWDPHSTLTPRSKDWHGPSWSWISAGRGVTFPTRVDIQSAREFCTVLDAHCTPSSRDITGHVSTGLLKISGCLIQVKITGHDTDGWHDAETVYISGLRPEQDSKDDFHPDHAIFQNGKTDFPTTIYCLKVALTVFIKGSRNRIWFMVLRCVDSKAQIYERIGALNFPSFEETQKGIDIPHVEGKYATITIR